MNNKLFIPIEMPYLVPVGLFFLLWIANQKKNYINCVENHPTIIPTKVGPISLGVFREED